MSTYGEQNDRWTGLRAGGVRGMLVFACALAMVVWCATAPAFALSQRGHSHAFSFGVAGSGDGQLSSPSSVAVDEATGEVYVSDTANDRIDQFEPQTDSQGTITGYRFKRVWGWGVADGKQRYETCESGCKAGIKGGKFFDSPGQVAVDNSTDPSDPSRGDVYVIANHLYEEKALVYEFGPEGEPVSTTEQDGPEGAPAGHPLPAGQTPMALGTIEEEAEGKPGKWKRNQEGTKELGSELEVIEGVAVDANGIVWLYGENGEFRAFTPHGALTEYEPALTPPELGIEKAPGRSGIAVRTVALGGKGSVTQDRLYARYEAEGEATEGKVPKHGFCAVGPCLTAEIDAFTVVEDLQEHLVEEEEGEALSTALGGSPSTGIAVDPDNGDAYLDGSTSIAALGSSGATIQSFGSAEGDGFAGLEGGTGLAVDHAAGAEVGYVYAADAAADQIDVFAPSSPGPPAVDASYTREVAAESARLGARIDPDGAPTTYTVQYSTSACAESPSSCAQHFTCTAGPATCGELPAPPGDAGEGFGDRDVSVSLPALAPSSTYHYRFLAANPHGQAVSDTEGSFSTPPAKGGFVADEREWELVSPAEKSGALIQPLTEGGAVIQAARDGGAFTYVATAPIGETEGSRSFEATQMLSTRGPDGWESQDIVTPNERGIGLGVGVGSEYRFFSEDLALALVQPFFTGRLAEPPLSPPLTAREEGDGPGEGQENTISLRDDKPITPQAAEDASYEEARLNGLEMDEKARLNGLKTENPGFLALVTDMNVAPGAEFGVPRGGNPALVVSGATPDLSHVVIGSEFEGKPGCEPDRLGCTAGLYEWNAGEAQLRYVSVLPNGEPVGATARLGQYSQSVRHAISSDGSRVVFSDKVGEQHVYLRDTTSEQTLQLDQVQGGTGEGPQDAEFQTASANDSRVFFTDTQQLTPHSGASAHRPDLYVCELAENDMTHKLEACKLTDLTTAYETKAAKRESGDVRGLVLGASEDGAYVYFVAGGVLTEAPNAQHEAPAPGGALCGSEVHPQATCNLYEEHYGSEPGNPGWPEHPTFVAGLSNEDLPDWLYFPVDREAVGNREGRLQIQVNMTSRVAPDGRYLAFMSDRELTHYDNVDASPEAEGAHDEEVYEYAAPSAAEEERQEPGRLVCASCDPSGARPHGVYDPQEGTASPEGVGLLVDRPRTWARTWLAASVPGWTRLANGGEPPYTLYQSRYLSNSGRLFFDSPADLVPEAKNEREDVYEYEPAGVPHGSHACRSSRATFDAGAEGCLGLISSGTSTSESAFLDASESGGEGEHGETLAEGGGDVFFVTAEKLSPRDTEGGFDVYDAHECTSASPCHPEREAIVTPPCASAESCRPYTAGPAPAYGAPASAGTGAAGNLAPQHAVLPSITSVKPKPLTRAQKLARALNACRTEHRHSKPRRQSCERQARKRYGPATKKAKGSQLHGARKRGSR